MKRMLGVTLVLVGAIGLVGLASCGPGSNPPDDECYGSDCPGNGSDAGNDQSCSGCMLDGSCRAGNLKEACGSGGVQCSQCGQSEECSDEGVCVEKSCSPDNCDGCCQNGECIQESDEMACGTGGESCKRCSEGERCIEDSCTTCDGCWTENGQCEDGTSVDACGAGGDACVTCGDGEICEDGSCVEQNCSESCDGCCVDGECQDGTSDDACGTSGNSCETCGDGLTCNTSGGCVPDPQSTWDIVGVSATIDKETVGGDPSSPPDPKLEVTVGDQTASTSKKDDTHEPFWDETTATGVTTEDIKSDLTYKMIDIDIASDDVIVGNCQPSFTDEDIQSGMVTHECVGGKDDNNKATTEFRFQAAE
jgi:hypothetical protein